MTLARVALPAGFARWPSAQGTLRSNPTRASRTSAYRGLATTSCPPSSMAEHGPCKAGVLGSNPRASSSLHLAGLPAGSRQRRRSILAPQGAAQTRRMSCNRLVNDGVPPYCTLDLQRAHQIARERGPVLPVYWVVRVILQPFFHVYFRLRRIGLEHVPKTGPVLMAANHRSFSDPFVIGCCLGRPLHFVAKVELFDKRWKAWLLLALGAFPICRGESDEEAMETARVILERGGVVGIFPEGTRVRPGPLGEPKRGVGRLVLETGAPVVPVSIIGTEDIRRGWRIRPRRVTVRCGRVLTFPRPLDREP